MSHRRRRRHRKNRTIRIALIILGSILFAILVAVLSAWYLWNRSSKLNEETMFQPPQRVEVGAPTPTPAPTPEPAAQVPEAYDLYMDGKYYGLRKNILAVLFMGVDSKTNEAADSEYAIGTNQTDTLLLCLLDTESGGVRMLHIPRDTKTDIRVLDMAGRYVRTESTHLCLQHAYGDGGPLSCGMTVDAVSNLLFGIPINRYVSMGTNGVAKAVNAVGGVTLVMLDDFTFYSGSMAKGETVKLNGNRALVYIQARQEKRLDDETDQGRIQRQMQFLRAFIDRLREGSKENPALVLSVYNAVKDYVQTDLSLEELLYLANQGLAAELTEESIIRLPGTMGDEEQPFFHMDEEAARAIVLELFYEEIPLE